MSARDFLFIAYASSRFAETNFEMLCSMPEEKIATMIETSAITIA